MKSDLQAKNDRSIRTVTLGLRQPPKVVGETSSAAFFWLTAFYLVYCARPEDWVPGLSHIPLAKVSAVFAGIGLFMSLGRTRRGFRDLPKEASYLAAMIAIMFASAFLSPVWRGGAVFHTLDFAKIYLAWVLTFLLVTSFTRLRRLIFIQAASVALIALVSLIKGHNTPRLGGVLAGIYDNPNDLAFAIVLSIPLCLAFFLSAKGVIRKVAWLTGMLFMAVALFLTASRAGFIDLVAAGTVCLWHFGVKGRRPQLVLSAVLLVALIGGLAGGKLKDRFSAISGDVNSTEEQKAYGSFEERAFLIRKSIEGIEHHPLLGIGSHNFVTYSGIWKQVHVTYLQICVETGIPALILYLMFFYRGFANLRRLGNYPSLDPVDKLFAGALHASLVGFIIGASFAPEAYQFFPFFAVAYSAAFLAIAKEQTASAAPVTDLSNPPQLHRDAYATNQRSNALTPAR